MSGAIHSKYTNTYRHDDLTLGHSLMCDFENEKNCTKYSTCTSNYTITVTPSNDHQCIRYSGGIYLKLREICETPARLARHLRAMFTVASTCESLACDLRVILASTCEYLRATCGHVRASVTSCGEPLEMSWGQYVHNKNIFKTKLAYCWALKYHRSVMGHG